MNIRLSAIILAIPTLSACGQSLSLTMQDPYCIADKAGKSVEDSFFVVDGEYYVLSDTYVASNGKMTQYPDECPVTNFYVVPAVRLSDGSVRSTQSVPNNIPAPAGTPEIVAESAEAGTAQASEVVSGGTVAQSASTGNVSVSEVSMTDAPNDTGKDGDDATVTAGSITIHRDGSVTTPNLGRVK